MIGRETVFLIIFLIPVCGFPQYYGGLWEAAHSAYYYQRQIPINMNNVNDRKRNRVPDFFVSSLWLPTVLWGDMRSCPLCLDINQTWLPHQLSNFLPLFWSNYNLHRCYVSVLRYINFCREVNEAFISCLCIFITANFFDVLQHQNIAKIP